jgi:hypothetical protein
MTFVANVSATHPVSCCPLKNRHDVPSSINVADAPGVPSRNDDADDKPKP